MKQPTSVPAVLAVLALACVILACGGGGSGTGSTGSTGTTGSITGTLTTIVGPDGSNGFVAWVNEAGQMVGTYGNTNGIACYWPSPTGTSVALKNLAGFPASSPSGMNASGAIVGYISLDNATLSGSEAAYWPSPTADPIKLPKSTSMSGKTFAHSINDGGEIIGSDSSFTNRYHWSSAAATPSLYSATDGYQIANNGAILGNTHIYRSYLDTSPISIASGGKMNSAGVAAAAGSIYAPSAYSRVILPVPHAFIAPSAISQSGLVAGSDYKDSQDLAVEWKSQASQPIYLKLTDGTNAKFLPRFILNDGRIIGIDGKSADLHSVLFTPVSGG